MGIVNHNVRFSYDDYKTLPESMDKIYELLDGDIIMVPAPSTTHQRVLRNLGFFLIQFVREHSLGEVFQAPVDVVFGEGNAREVVQPDLIFINKERKNIITEEEIRGAPDLVVEILSPATKARDQGYKKRLYARYGVKEYWIVDPKAKAAEIYTPQASGFETAERYNIEDQIISALFPNLEVRIEELFQEN